MTPWECVSLCKAQSLPYSGVTNSTDCYCGKSSFGAPSNSQSSFCNQPCIGDFNSICGGFYDISLYQDNEPPIYQNDQKWQYLLSRGRRNKKENETSTWNIAFSETPYRRSGATAVNYGRSIVIFGGMVNSYTTPKNVSIYQDPQTIVEEISYYNGQYFNDVWLFDLDTHEWELLHDGVSSLAPLPMSLHTAVIDPSDPKSMLVFGGFTYEQIYTNNVWQFSFESRQWTKIIPTDENRVPTRRARHAAVGIPGGMIVMGGDAGVTRYNKDVWQFTTSTRQWRLLHDGKGNAPAPRSRHSFIPIDNSHTRFALAFGVGLQDALQCYTERIFRDVWIFDRSTREWTPLNEAFSPWDLNNHRWATLTPERRYYHNAIVVSAGMIVFGGFREGLENDGDLWGFDFSTRLWQRLAPYENGLPIPEGRSRYSMVQTTNGMFLFGGSDLSDTIYYNDVWEWNFNGTEFTPIPGTRGSTGKNMGVAMAILWFLLVVAAITFYFPHKMRAIRGRKEIQQKIPDNDVFSIDKKRYKEEKQLGKSISASIISYDHKNNFDILPDEVILHIFNHLKAFEIGRMASVCRRFYRLANDDIFWNDLCNQLWSKKEKKKEVDQATITQTDTTVSEFDVELDEIPQEPAIIKVNTDIDSDDEEEEELHIKGRALYLRRLQKYRKMRSETRLLHKFLAIRTSSWGIALALLFSLQIYFLGMKLDHYIHWHWGAVFTPLWIINSLVLAICGVSLFVICGDNHKSKYASSRRTLTRVFPALFGSKVTTGVFCTGLLAFVAFAVLLTCQLAMMEQRSHDDESEDDSEFSWTIVDSSPTRKNSTKVLSWVAVMTPLLYSVVALVIVLPLIRFHRKGWRWSESGAFGFGIGIVATIALISARLISGSKSQLGNVDWCILILPWWLSDMMALLMVVSCCISRRDPRTGWALSGLFLAYAVSMVTFRALLCVNLGETCGDRIGYNYTLIFVPLQLALFACFLPGCFFLRHTISKTNNN